MRSKLYFVHCNFSLNACLRIMPDSFNITYYLGLTLPSLNETTKMIKFKNNKQGDDTFF